jgi:hypothetical protein
MVGSAVESKDITKRRIKRKGRGGRKVKVGKKGNR